MEFNEHFINACVCGYRGKLISGICDTVPPPGQLVPPRFVFFRSRSGPMNLIMAVLTEAFSGCVGRRYPVKRSRTEEEEATERNFVFLSWAGSGSNNGGSGLCK